MSREGEYGKLLECALKPLLALLLFLGFSAVSRAVELSRVDVDSDGDVYSIRLEMLLDVAVDLVHEVLTDYRHIYRLNPSIVESRLLPSPDDNTARVYTRMEGCLFFFCTQVTRVEDVRELGNGELLAVIVPGMSDFESGTALWRVSRQGQGSRLVYEARMQPEFFIPPLVGRFLVKNRLKSELTVIFQRIECAARARLWARQTVTGGASGEDDGSRAC